MPSRGEPDRRLPLEDPPRPSGANPFLLVGTIVAAKVATIVVILAMEWSTGAGLLVAATTGHWVVVLAALVATPVAFAIRLRRVRSRRAALLRAEWALDDSPADRPRSARRTAPARTIGQAPPGR